MKSTQCAILRLLAFAAFGAVLCTSPAAATPLTFGFSGNFGTLYSGPLNGGTFSGTYSIGTLPLTPPDTGTSYVYLPSYDVFLKKGATVVEFKPGLNGSVGVFSAVYETANGGDFFQFYDSSNDNLTLYVAKGFTGVSAIITTTTKGYISDGGVGGYGGGNISNITSGAASIPEPSAAALLAGAIALMALRRKWLTRRT